MSDKISVLKRNLATMSPRPFGEKVGEWLIQKLFPELEKRLKNSHDGLLQENIVEIKVSRALNKDLHKTSVLEQLIVSQDRILVPFDKNDDFLCNIQQIKPSLFDTLIYGIFFDDKICIFQIESEVLVSDKKIGYIDKQHRGNNGEGQFHIKRHNLNYHLENFLTKVVNYEDVLIFLENDFDHKKNI